MKVFYYIICAAQCHYAMFDHSLSPFYIFHALAVRMGFIICLIRIFSIGFDIKGSLLHEFGGERDITMQAANGETLATSKDYGDTWYRTGCLTAAYPYCCRCCSPPCLFQLGYDKADNEKST